MMMYHLGLPEICPQAARHPGPGLQHAGELGHPHSRHSGKVAERKLSHPQQGFEQVHHVRV